MNLPFVPNYGLLNNTPSDPAGYVSKDGMWAAVPFENKFVIIHNGHQVHTANNYKTARSYISKHIKATAKKVSSTSTLENFLK